MSLIRASSMWCFCVIVRRAERAMSVDVAYFVCLYRQLTRRVDVHIIMSLTQSRVEAALVIPVRW